jgi:nitroreductase
MNDTLQSIANRRSIRQFKAEQISDAQLEAIVTAVLQAPSGHNDQSCYLVAVQNRELIDEMNAGSKREMQQLPVEWIADLGRNDDYHIYYHAPTVVVVAARTDAITPVPDVCAAIQNMLIAAESLGVGSCWMGFARFHFASPEARRRIGLPEGYEVHYAVALGYKPDGLELEPRPEKMSSRWHTVRP